ncbi:MAG: Spy/CpxP family protein refolding chaperone [Cyanobacteria bacterium J06627_32]
MNQQLALSTGVFTAIALVIIGTGGFQKANSITNTINDVQKETSSMLKSRSSVLSDIEDLSLSPTQNDEIEAIKAEMMVQMAEILTPAQMETFQSAQSSGEDTRSVMRSLGLDNNQRSEVIGLMRITQNKVMSVLTPEQRAQIEDELPRDRN